MTPTKKRQRNPQVDQPPTDREAQRAQTERGTSEGRPREPPEDELQH